MNTNSIVETLTCDVCGGQLNISTAPFIEKGCIPITDVEHYECAACGHITCNNSQWQVLQSRVLNWHIKRKKAILDKTLPKLDEVKSFHAVESEEDADVSFDDVLDWVGQGNNIATIDVKDSGRGLRVYPPEFFQGLADAALPAAPMELWNLEGFCAEDMPTLQDVFRAIGEEALSVMFDGSDRWVNRVWTKSILSGSGDSWWGREFLDKIRGSNVAPCDACPRVVMPYRECVENTETASPSSCLVAGAFAMSSPTKLDCTSPASLEGMTLEEALGLKAWFGGLGLYDMYLALGSAFAQLAANEGVLPKGINVRLHETGHIELDEESKEEMLERLQNKSREELEGRIANLERRLLPIDELDTIDLEIDLDLLVKVTTIAQTKGLSIQNFMNLLIEGMLNEPAAKMKA